MDILHVVSSIDPRYGGPVEALRGLTAAQSRAGLGVRVISAWRHGDDLGLADDLRARGVAVTLVGPCWGRYGWHPSLGAEAFRALAGAAVCHIHAVWEAVQHVAARHAAAAGVPYLIRPCGMLDPWSLGQNWAVKRAYLRLRLRADLNRAAVLHFTTRTEADLTRPLGLTVPALIEPNGISPAEFADLPPPGVFRSAHSIPADARVVLFLSRLHPKKGLDLLLPAFARRAEAGDVLVLAGPVTPAYRAALGAEAARIGIGDRVRFAGMLRGADKLAAYAAADLYVLPSYQENFGIAVVEALAAGLPVLISDQVNIHHEVTAAGVGGVVPTRVEPLADELGRWLAALDLRREAAARAGPFARSRYDWDAIAARWVEHYRRLAG